MYFQVDTKDLNGELLCDPPDRQNKRGSNRVLSDWRSTSSPLWSYWGKMFQNHVGLGDYILPTTRCTPDEIPLLFTFGLPHDEADSVCKSRYTNEVVKLTVQIADPTVMMIEKDVSANFTDKLGVIGKTGKNYGSQLLSNCYLFRWDNWSLYRAESDQCGGSILLATEGTQC